MRKISLLFFSMLILSAVAPAQTHPPKVAEDEYYDDEQYVYDDEYVTVTEEMETVQASEHFATPDPSERGETHFNPRHLDKEFKDNYNGKRFDYDSDFKQIPKKDSNTPSLNLSFLFSKVFIYTLLGIIILVVVYYIIKNTGGFSFGTAPKKIKYTASAEQLFEDRENIENNDFKYMVQKAKSQGDFRSAVRYYFLWVLQTMFDKNLIDWNKDKTNDEYLRELKNHSIREDFHKNSFIFEYIWYGNFEIDSQSFENAESIFQKTLNKLK